MPSASAPMDMDALGVYDIELFDTHGNLVDSRTIHNTVRFTALPHIGRLYQFWNEFGSGYRSPFIGKHSNSNPIGRFYLCEDTPNENDTFMIAAPILGAVNMNYSASAGAAIYGSYNSAQSKFSCENGWFTAKTVFEFGTSQCNGTIKGIIGTSCATGSAPNYTDTSDCTAEYLPKPWSGSTQADQSSSFALYSGTTTIDDKWYSITNRAFIDNYLLVLQGLEEPKYREPEAIDELVFPSMVSYADPTKAYSLYTTKPSGNEPVLNVITYDLTTHTHETREIRFYDKCSKLKKYLGTSGADTTSYINNFVTYYLVNGVWIGHLVLSAKSSMYPGIDSAGNLLGAYKTRNEYVFCAYDLTADKWLVEPDLENPLCGTRVAGTDSSSARRSAPGWIRDVSGVGDMPHTLETWRTAKASSLRYILGPSNINIYKENTGDNNAHFVYNRMMLNSVAFRSVFGSSYREHNTTQEMGSNTNTNYYGDCTSYWHKYNTIVASSNHYDLAVGTRLHAYRSLTKLQPPIVKTAEYTMKLTYTIQFKVPNVFAEPGHEYDYLDELQA